MLYETHSQLSAENEDMVTQVLQEVNRAAQYKHAELQGKITLPNTAKTEASASSLVCIFLAACLSMYDR